MMAQMAVFAPNMVFFYGANPVIRAIPISKELGKDRWGKHAEEPTSRHCSASVDTRWELTRRAQP
jgi:hypothetical protein